MTALMIDSPWAVGMIVVVALLLFGGTRLAGLGKSAGRAIKEFKEETSGVLGTPQVDQSGRIDQAAQPGPDS
ncbi:twin-arginine translocase TatA/TatE family subunit [Microlunatus sp. Gsoil 973]|uniref:twin-arginine translocase TatA/TatE family subunit n=1 Tax=Microlunatus sp. Gsoil 973 TaxID=2672569 RepID=UPI0012B4E8AE|nr:twin-arginine translocase TatA/TatE family subunit [Microlunatus sp. Gsoil 973]QGN34049.1 Sec-independent protein translocase TatA [Microlunatus sp. Gsoil 973]